MIIFEGISEEPCYVVIEDDKVEFFDASDLWGMGSHDAEAVLADKYGTDYSIMSIGPGGEKLSNMACINSGLLQAGRKRRDRSRNGIQEDEGCSHQGDGWREGA